MSPDLNCPSGASKSGRFRTFVAWVCGPILLLEIIAVAIILMVPGCSAKTYLSVAKLRFRGWNPELNTKLKSGDLDLIRFLETQMYLIQTGELWRRALVRVVASHPDWDHHASRIEANMVRNNDMPVIVIRSTGANPAFAQGILDAVVDEYFNMRIEMSRSNTITPSELRNELRNLEEVLHWIKRERSYEEQAGRDQTRLEDFLARATCRFDELKVTLREVESSIALKEPFTILQHASPAIEVKSTFFIWNIFK